MALIVLLNFGVIYAIDNSITPPGSPPHAIVSFKGANDTSVTTSVNDIYKRFGKIFLVVDFCLIVFSTLFGYALSGVTLRPIQKNMDEQEEFAQEVSHELRTPLSVVTMEIETLKRTEKHIAPSYAAAFKNMDEELERMGTLVSGLLSLVHSDEKNYIQLHKAFDITAAANLAFLQFQKIAEEKNILYTFASMYDGKIYGNEKEIKQVILILLDNAIKYSRKGDSVSVTIEGASGGARVSVTDTGIGISKKDLPHVFDRFYRVKSRTSPDIANGLGLGLAIARKKIELHKGKLLIYSEHGKGTTVSAYLPSKMP
jgi:signal transduction histidine kinase